MKGSNMSVVMFKFLLNISPAKYHRETLYLYYFKLHEPTSTWKYWAWMVSAVVGVAAAMYAAQSMYQWINQAPLVARRGISSE